MAAIRTLICDDAPEFRLLLRMLLEAEGDIEVVGEAADGHEVASVARELRPDVVFLDLNMPRRDGLEALPEVRAAAPDARVVVLSGLARSRLAPRALELGAHGYVEKGCSAAVLRRVARRAAAGMPLGV